MGPPAPGVDALGYYAGIAREQWREYSVSQRLTAWSLGKSVSLLSHDVQRGFAAHTIQAVHPVLLVHTPSVKRTASMAFGKLERGVGSLSRSFSTRRTRQDDTGSRALNDALDAALAQPAAALQASTSDHSMVPSIFSVRPAHSAQRRVHFDEAPHAKAAAAQLLRHATALRSEVKPMAAAALRPSRSLPTYPSKSSMSPASSKRGETGFILIGLEPSAVLPPAVHAAPEAIDTPKPVPPLASLRPNPMPMPPRTLGAALVTFAAVQRPVIRGTYLAPPAGQTPAVQRLRQGRAPLSRELIAKGMIDRLCLSLTLA